MEGVVKHAASVGAQIAQNGILSQDDYYVNGVPKSPFALDVGTDGTLAQVFAAHRHVDPFAHVQEELNGVTDFIQDLVGSDHKVLSTVASYFIESAGKRIRPAIVIMMSEALRSGERAVMKQNNIAQIAEMIHTASLLHDDVIDKSDTRRGLKTINKVFGNKLAVLGGDFLLARASLLLATLGNPRVIELMSTIIEHLVKGELMQIHKYVSRTAATAVDMGATTPTPPTPIPLSFSISLPRIPSLLLTLLVRFFGFSLYGGTRQRLT